MISRIMPDSGDLAGSSHCFVTDPRPPSSSSTRKSVRLASCLNSPFSPVSALCKWKALQQLPQSSCLASLRSPCLHPGSRRRVTRPGFCSSSPPIFLPGFDVFFYSGHLPCFIHLVHGFSPALKSSLTQLLQEFTSNSATRRSTHSSAPPTDIHPRNARPGSSLR
ncbi:hypothetical protein CRENBAI_007443, partial [Crenichthys baileyi]